MTAIETFGTTAAGETVHRIRIAGGGLVARIMTWGAAVQDLRIEGHAPPLVLGFRHFDEYPAHSPYFGAMAGRYANRIRDGRFRIGERLHQVDANFLGRHLLHGGARGTGKRVWTLAEHGPSHVALTLQDRDGEMGFPGNLDVTCIYRLTERAELAIEVTAVTDAPTLCNFAHHSYFNLDDGGAGSVGQHRLTIAADTYLPVDDELIPTGEIAPVAGTPFDFRVVRTVRGDGTVDHDHNWCLAPARRAMAFAARLEGARSGLSMEVHTSEPGLQFYAGHKVARPLPGLDGIAYGANAGLCLEPQVWPDSPNHADFPQALLLPGETYRQDTAYRFFAPGA